NGAVGPDHLMVTLNTQVRVQDREGTALSTVTLNAFWAALGNPDTFDPKIAYDPFEGRWIFAVVANPETRRSAVLVAVSQTSDPTGAWNLFAVAADPNRKLWADFPSLGFNKDWVVITANMFTLRRNRFARTRLFVFDKADLYANGRGRVTVLAGSSGSFTLCPALTYDDALATLFLLDDLDGSHLRISTITGAVGAETLTVGTGFVTSPDAWGVTPPGALRTDTVAKEGEAPYAKRLGKSRVRWGDYSNACVDPLNDTDLWTIQEFAATPSEQFDRWGTWWARVAVAPSGPVAPRITSVLVASAVERVP